MKPYIPKIKLWTDKSTFTTYVFLGRLYNQLWPLLNKSKHDKDAIKSILGKQYKSILDLKNKNVEYHPGVFFEDDTISIFTKKLAYYLNIKSAHDLYLWAEQDVRNDPNVIYGFINNCFKNEKKISFSLFQQYVTATFMKALSDDDVKYNMIDKKTAAELLLQLGVDKMIEPLGFKYTYNNFIEYIDYAPFNSSYPSIDSLSVVNLSPYTLSSFQLNGNVINVVNVKSVSKKLHGTYFPFQKSKDLKKEDIDFIEIVNTMQNEVEMLDVSNVTESTIISFLHIKGNESVGGKRVLLDTMFNKLKSSSNMPFLKYKTPTNIVYKVYKKALLNISTDNITKWTNITVSKDDRSFIMMKMLFKNNMYCTLTINSDLSYYVKFNFGLKDAVTLKEIEVFFGVINKILSEFATEYEDIYIPLIDTNVLYKSHDSHVVKIVQMITSSTLNVHSLKINYDKFQDVIKTKLIPYFNIISNPDKSLLHLQYKKVDNFMRFDTIQSFIAHNSGGMEDDEIVKQIMYTFMISIDDAIKELETWKTNDDKEKEKQRFLKHGADFINIKIRLNAPVDMKFIINGVKNIDMQTKIEYLLKALIVFANEKKKASNQEIKKLQKLDNMQMDKLEKITIDNSVEISETDDEDGLVDVDTTNNELDLDDELLALEREFIKTSDSNTSIKKDIATNTANNKKTKNDPVHANEDLLLEKASKSGKLKGYILSKLHEADKYLFDYTVPKDQKRKNYSSLCGWVDRRQPVVVTNEELNKIKKEFPSAISGSVKTGSSPDYEAKYNYICPQVWCPKSRVALTQKQYDELGQKCPYPNVEEDAIVFSSKYWGTSSTTERHPGFLDKYTRTDGLCLPCCFKKSAKEGNRNYQRQDLCMKEKMGQPNTSFKKEEQEDNIIVDEPKDIIGNEKYIKGENYSPLENNRYGLVPATLKSYLGELVCGSRHDGTGLMSDSTNCYLRKGIAQSSQSFLECMANVLENKRVNNANDFVQELLNNLSVVEFVALEDGRIMKMFIDDGLEIYNPNIFKDFKQWFIDQSQYITKFNLKYIKDELQAMSKKDTGFSRDITKYAADIIREFLIYNAFISFKKYIANKDIIKEHYMLLDMINTLDWLNVNNYNFVVLDFDPATEKLFIDCQFNKNMKDVVDLRRPFIFVLKRNTYYEPLYHVTTYNTTVMSDNKVFLDTTSEPMQKLLKYVIENCSATQAKKGGIDGIITFLQSKGYKIKYHVIDYGYKVCGIIIDKNLYIPLPSRQSYILNTDSKYVYLSDVPKFKCTMMKDAVLKIYKQLKEYEGSSFYKVTIHIKDKNTLQAIVLENDVFVPLNISTNKRYIKTYFENGLHIFVGEEFDDKRIEILGILKEKTETVDKTLQLIQKELAGNKELEFLLDSSNPLPNVYKRNKIGKLLSKVLPKSTTNEFIGNLIYNLTNDIFSNRKIKKFVAGRDEVVLDHFDVQHGKLNEIIQYQRDPHKAIIAKLNNIAERYIFPEHQHISFSEFINEKTPETDMPVKWRKIFKGYNATELDDNYTNTYIWGLFKALANAYTLKDIDDVAYKGIFLNKLASDYEKGKISDVLANPTVKDYIKKRHIANVLYDDLVDVSQSLYYYPNNYDIRIMSKIANVNVVILGRKTTSNPDGIEVIDNKHKYYLIMIYNYNRFRKVDVYDIVHIKTKFLFERSDLPNDFIKVVEHKSKLYEVDVTDSDEEE